jgi:hypothetical protein
MKPDVCDKRALIDALEGMGAEFKGDAFKCLWHPDGSPSAGIYAGADNHWRYKCHQPSCGVHGDLIDLQAMNEKKTPSEIIKQTTVHKTKAQRYHGTLEECVRDSAAYRKQTVDRTYHYRSHDGQQILLAVSRFLTGDINHDTGKPKKSFHQAHWTDRGWVSAKPPGKQPIYNLPGIASASAIVVVEGEKCADALIALGLCATTSPGGSGNAKDADWSPLSGKRVVIMRDNDEAGQGYHDDIVAILQALPTPPVHLASVDVTKLGLQPKEDVCEYIDALIGDPREGMIEVLRAAIPIGQTTPVDALFAHYADQASGSYFLAPWPFQFLTKISRSLLPGKVAIVGGPPGGAKSWFMLETVLNLIRLNITVAQLALEEPWPWHASRALAHLSQNPDILDNEWVKANQSLANLAAEHHKETLNKLGKAMTCRGNPTFADCLEWIADRCKEGVRVLVIDPITLADPGHDDKWTVDRTFMAKAKEIIDKHGASLILVTHPTKSASRGRGPTTMDDMAGGTAYPRAAASVLWLTSLEKPTKKQILTHHGYLDSLEIHKEIIIMKSRDSTGAGSRIGFRFIGLHFQEMGKIISDRPGTAAQNPQQEIGQ